MCCLFFRRTCSRRSFYCGNRRFGVQQEKCVKHYCHLLCNSNVCWRQLFPLYRESCEGGKELGLRWSGSQETNELSILLNLKGAHFSSVKAKETKTREQCPGILAFALLHESDASLYIGNHATTWCQNSRWSSGSQQDGFWFALFSVQSTAVY